MVFTCALQSGEKKWFAFSKKFLFADDDQILRVFLIISFIVAG